MKGHVQSQKKKTMHHCRNTHETCAAIAISQIMNGNKVTEEIKGMPVSSDNICQHVSKMGQDIKCQLNDRVKQGKYALQLDESWPTWPWMNP